MNEQRRHTGISASMINRPAQIFILMALVLAVFLFGPPLAFAQDAQESKPAAASPATSPPAKSSSTAPPKKTTVNFEDQLIEGQTQKPELFYLLQQRSNNFKRLIKLRENFLPEMRDTAEDISRRGNGH